MGYWVTYSETFRGTAKKFKRKEKSIEHAEKKVREWNQFNNPYETLSIVKTEKVKWMSYWDMPLPTKQEIKKLKKEAEKHKEEVALINERHRLEKEISQAKHAEFVEKHRKIFALAEVGKKFGKEVLSGKAKIRV